MKKFEKITGLTGPHLYQHFKFNPDSKKFSKNKKREIFKILKKERS